MSVRECPYCGAGPTIDENDRWQLSYRCGTLVGEPPLPSLKCKIATKDAEIEKFRTFYRSVAKAMQWLDAEGDLVKFANRISGALHACDYDEEGGEG